MLHGVGGTRGVIPAESIEVVPIPYSIIRHAVQSFTIVCALEAKASKCQHKYLRMQKMQGCSAHLGPAALHCWRACGAVAVAVDGAETAASAGGTAAAPAP